MRIFYDRLMGLKEEHNLSMYALAEILKVNQYTISNWKKEYLPTLRAVIAASEYFSVSTDYLLGMTNSRERLAELKPLPYETLQLISYIESQEFTTEQLRDILKMIQQIKNGR